MASTDAAIHVRLSLKADAIAEVPKTNIIPFAPRGRRRLEAEPTAMAASDREPALTRAWPQPKKNNGAPRRR